MNTSLMTIFGLEQIQREFTKSYLLDIIHSISYSGVLLWQYKLNWQDYGYIIIWLVQYKYKLFTGINIWGIGSSG